MKTLFKILTPTISTIGIAAITLSSCAATGDGYTAIPKELLDIEGITLQGFKEPTEEIKGYDKLTVPKEIESVKLIYHSDPKELAFNCIKKIDYESGSNWKTITNIVNLPNLEYLVLPPKLTSIGTNVIHSCPKIATIDISNVEDISYLSSTNWITINGTLEYDSGTLIIRKDQASKVSDIKSKNHCLNKFETKEK